MKKLYTFMAVIILISPGYAQPEAEQLLKAIVKVKSTIPSEARTAGVLGTTREGNGVLIDAEGHILSRLIATGSSGEPPQPWLGLQIDEVHGRLFVRRVTSGGPAEKAGLGSGDIVLKVDQNAVQGLADFYRKVWSLGKAGVDVPVAVLQGIEIRDIVVRSEDRDQYYRILQNK